MADQKVILEFSDDSIKQELVDTIALLKKVAEETEKSGKAVQAEFLKGIKANAEFAAQMKKTVKDAESLNKELKESNEAVKSFGEGLEEGANQQKVFGLGLGSIGKGIKNLIGGFARLIPAAGNLGKALRVVAGAIAATGIGALVVAVASLASFFLSTEKGAKLLKQALAGIGAVVNSITQRFQVLGSTILGVFTGKNSIGDVINVAKVSLVGLTAEMQRAFERAVAITQQLQEIREAQKDTEVEYSQAVNRIKELNLAAEDENKTLKERAQLITEAIELERSFIDEKLESKRTERALVFEQFQADKQNLELKQEVRDLDKEIADLYSKSLDVQTTLTRRLNRLNSEAAAAAKKARDEQLRYVQAFEQIKKNIEGLATAAALDIIDDPIERIRAEYQLAKEQLKALEKEARDAALAAGQTFELGEEFALLFQQAYLRFAQEMNKVIDETEKKGQDAKDKISELLRDLRQEAQEVDAFLKGPAAQLQLAFENEIDRLISLDAFFRNQFEDGLITKEQLAAALDDVSTLIDGATEAYQNGIDDLTEDLNIWEKFRRNIGNLLGLTAAELDVFTDTLGLAFGNAIDGFQTQIDAQLEANDKLIDAIRERREIIEEELDQELRAQELGYANNVDAKKRELEEIAIQEKKAQAEREKIQKKAARVQLIADAAQQASSLATAAGNLLAAESFKGVFGFAIAAAAIASMFSLFARIKAQASKASQPTRLYKGGSVGEATRDFGIVQERGGRSDVPGRNRGHMVEGTNLMLGGREFVHKESVSQQHRDFFELLNANEHLFRGVDLIDLFSTKKRTDIGRPARDFAFDRKVMTAVDRKRKEEMSERAMEKAFGKVIEKQTKDLIRYDETKEQIFVDGGKRITIQKSRGEKKTIISPITS